MDKVNGPDVENMELIKLEFFMDQGNPAYNFSQQFTVVKDGFPKELIKGFMA
jgi:hypothetical protein